MAGCCTSFGATAGASRMPAWVWVGVPAVGLLALMVFVCGGVGVWFFAVRASPGRASPAGSRPDFFPLKVGSSWEYDFELQVGVLPVQRGTVVHRIDGMENINGRQYFSTAVVITGVPGMEADAEYRRKDDGGAYVMKKHDVKFGEELAFPIPYAVGKEWVVKDPEGEHRRRVEGEEDLHLVNQTYRRCLKVHTTVASDNLGGSVDSYYAPGVGLVKRLISMQDNLGRDVRITVTLKKYTP